MVGQQFSNTVAVETSAPIDAWKSNFSPFKEIMTDRPTNQQIN